MNWCMQKLVLIFPALPFFGESMQLQHNRYSEDWLIKHKPKLLLLTFLTGGLYPVILFTHSGILGLEMFNNGISKIETFEFFGIKVITTVFLEVI